MCNWPGGSEAFRKGSAELLSPVSLGETRSMEYEVLPGLAVSERSVHVAFVISFFFKEMTAWLSSVTEVIYEKMDTFQMKRLQG